MNLIKRLKGLTRLTPMQRMEMWGVLCMASLVLGFGVSFLIEGKEWAILHALIPAFVYTIKGFFVDWSKPL